MDQHSPFIWVQSLRNNNNTYSKNDKVNEPVYRNINAVRKSDFCTKS
jgi:hypothetical protein